MHSPSLLLTPNHLILSPVHLPLSPVDIYMQLDLYMYIPTTFSSALLNLQLVESLISVMTGMAEPI